MNKKSHKWTWILFHLDEEKKVLFIPIILIKIKVVLIEIS